LNHAHQILFLVTGAAKAHMLDAVLNGLFEPDARPAQAIRPLSGDVHWLVDRAAASRLRSPDQGLDVSRW
jgi:6-phosphogluconolactonase